MKLVKIDPPGSWCHYETVLDLVQRRGAGRFIEVGCGAGDLSLKLCRKGLRGIGIDFSDAALASAAQNLAPYIESGQYRLVKGDILELDEELPPADVALSMMVMEHVEDHVKFVQRIARRVRPGGSVIVGVPGRRDRWGIEDETVGHLRRYDRNDLTDTLTQSGLVEVHVLSVAVPVANLLFHLSNRVVTRSEAEMAKVGQSARRQTESSGVREIPWKTVFPPWCRLILNRVTLWPLFVLQRAFYSTNLGLTMIGVGRVQ
jgi:SAM-dependent methyltransferase